ncbi:hypothetical protein [Phyllobacterium sp. YR531]|uniref:hypothetical protein n=1 Tax=Phyllobacterium sp. YR531 TaxID=1144343 RepID=UPI00026F75EA|nr:hypothetical protein [Phyllobacterium sp. YR531]EJM98866.1 hypothetical protein PMI41_04628 [Phyllobacterium sp. YR531]
MVTFILQALFLIAAAFIIGAILGNIFRRLSPKKPSAAESSTRAADLRLASQSTLVAGNDDVKKSAVAAAAMIPPAEPVPAGRVNAPRKSTLNKVELQPALRNPRQDDANRPASLKNARRGKPDKLIEIDGIGAVIESKLFALGIYHFDQIAAWTVEQADWVSIEIGFTGRAVRENWVKQAGALVKSAKPKAARKVAN